MTTLDEALAALPVIAIIRAAASRHLNAVLETLAGAGVRAMEVTMTTPGAAEAIRWAAGGGLPGVAIGAGTVLDADSARQAVDAGAGYLITPAVLPEVIGEGRRLGVPVLPGAFTPTEIVQAWSQGATMVKVFPAGAAGGPGYIKDVRAPLPHIPLVPTGGIGIGEVPAYLRAGARAVGMGSPLVGDACTDGDTAALAARAGRLVEVVRGSDG
ncbi:bifunctional 4-hydroxy-2-oxoglutarate aldolase/2-dehydro-3-deoxy-phosphogluconate aldolase [Nonomuraea sp. LP-02]|uniref:bifunctional 4-hydroxy-2-oxoglutarate aldolase/2-dehydro-3-deoxy-phosphogluconate aldolase n=1 Tax=Nonomuraea sp. LP-02 TaxID=3097960 RepID=UPI002E37385C|nr:bifunctional 4-hydroxy-2-oxoglutarate aldolase/2-dehydro-3-deoxy-phosphogluconate aldolase [Nonomuraea sp. LP-02]MED7931232.1 bifunctional 4-hydroxy-2-oxoglutarate aldolase/2-dehydro-3-deoxy-phosphogluconate aldolase [Nonomuraea sp. LP-02]